MTTALDLVRASTLLSQPPDWSSYRWRLLAEGDSWFSMGSLNPFSSANLLQSLAFSSAAVAAHCAYPGDTLRHMATLRADPTFVQMLVGNVSWRWDAILLSAGGNDLIDAAGSPPTAPAELRLLRPAVDWGAPSDGPSRYVSEPGWATFCGYYRENLRLIIELRDSKGGPDGSRGRPLCMHTYAYPTPRPSGGGLGLGPWLLPAMQAYAIPKPEWIGLARHLIDRLATLMLECAADAATFPALHVFDTRHLPVMPAALDATGASGDWANEIHLTHAGCDKVGLAWSQEIEAVMLANP